MNDRTKSVLERMRQNTQAVVDSARDKIAMAQTTQPEDCQPKNYQIISFPIRAAMKAGTDRHPSRHRELQEMMLT